MNVLYCKFICVVYEFVMFFVCWFFRVIFFEDIMRSFFWVWCRIFEGCVVCNLLFVLFFIFIIVDGYGVSFLSFMF